METPGRRPPPWKRERDTPTHPVGPARRRFPHAEGSPPERYRRGTDREAEAPVQPGERRRGGVRVERRLSPMERLRRNPVRHGVVGLAVAGAATPLAIARSNQLRTDPAHERTVDAAAARPLDDRTVGEAWRDVEDRMEEARSSTREDAIRRNLARFASYDVSRELAEDIHDIAVEEGIEPDVAFGLVRAESSFKNSATSHVGAIGLTQLMPRTAEWLQPGVTVRDLRDQRTNLRIGFKYLNDMLRKYDGSTHLALLAYNRGPGTVDRVLQRGADPDNGYPDMVLRDAGAKR